MMVRTWSQLLAAASSACVASVVVQVADEMKANIDEKKGRWSSCLIAAYSHATSVASACNYTFKQGWKNSFLEGEFLWF